MAVVSRRDTSDEGVAHGPTGTSVDVGPASELRGSSVFSLAESLPSVESAGSVLRLGWVWVPAELPGGCDVSKLEGLGATLPLEPFGVDEVEPEDAFIDVPLAEGSVVGVPLSSEEHAVTRPVMVKRPPTPFDNPRYSVSLSIRPS